MLQTTTHRTATRRSTFSSKMKLDTETVMQNGLLLVRRCLGWSRSRDYSEDMLVDFGNIPAKPSGLFELKFAELSRRLLEYVDVLYEEILLESH